MRFSLLSTGLMCVLLTMSVSANEQERERLGRYLNKLFTNLAEADDSSLSFDDGVVRVADVLLDVHVVPETVAQDQGRYFSATRFEVSINSKKIPGLTYGVVGIGESAEDASKTAVIEWYMGYGQALFKACADGAPSYVKGNSNYYAGLLGIRGEHPHAWLDQDDKRHTKITQAISSELPDGKAIFAITINVVVRDGGVDSVQCFIDGQESTDAAKAIQALDWPTNTVYMFKQSYVVKQVAQE